MSLLFVVIGGGGDVNVNIEKSFNLTAVVTRSNMFWLLNEDVNGGDDADDDDRFRVGKKQQTSVFLEPSTVFLSTSLTGHYYD